MLRLLSFQLLGKGSWVGGNAVTRTTLRGIAFWGQTVAPQVWLLSSPITLLCLTHQSIKKCPVYRSRRRYISPLTPPRSEFCLGTRWISQHPIGFYNWIPAEPWRIADCWLGRLRMLTRERTRVLSWFSIRKNYTPFFFFFGVLLDTCPNS